jgi:hypothetical protein
MKKIFTLILCAPLILLAQVPQKADIRAIKEANALLSRDIPSPVINKLRPAALHKTNSDIPVYGAVTIGNTLYDLQTNNAVANRLMVYPGGKVTAVWTTSSDGGTAYSQRGTGYNQSINGVWRKALPNNSRFENSRVGWPNLGVADFGGTQKEYVFAHAVATSGLTGGFVFSTNSGIGTDFTVGPTVLNDTYNAATTSGPIWARTATAGSHIVLISRFADSTSAYPVNYTAAGVKNPVTYSVYDAASGTWLTKNALLPGYDSTSYDIGAADDYSIDAVGNKVRIVLAGAFDDLAMWKSEDAGNSWTKVVIDSFASKKNFTPSLPVSGRKIVNNGAVNVSIDQWGYTHVVVPAIATAFDSLDANNVRTTYYNLSGDGGILYWSDKPQPGTGKPAPLQVIGFCPDQNANQTLDLASNTRLGIYGGYGTGLGSTTATRACAVSNQPMIAADSKGNLFCTYIAPDEGGNDVSQDNEDFNDIFVVYSKDTGNTWSQNPQNLTQTNGFEDVYPTLARTVDNDIHIMYMLDEDPGYAVNNSNNIESTNRINYMTVPVAKIIHDSVGIFPNGINPYKGDAGFTVSDNYPNPFSGVTQIDINTTKTSNIEFVVNDVLGKTIYSESRSNLEAGKHTISFNASGLSSGIYFYTVNNGSQKVSGKMIVE